MTRLDCELCRETGRAGDRVVSDSLVAGAKGVLSCVELVFSGFGAGDDEGVERGDKNAGDEIADRGVGWCRMATDVGIDVIWDRSAGGGSEDAESTDGDGQGQIGDVAASTFVTSDAASSLTEGGCVRGSGGTT
jgi:hypothetical protein